MRHIDLHKEKEKIIAFIRSYCKDSGFSKGIIGLSGGVDSSLVAYLAVEALYKDNVIGAMMPYKTSRDDSLEDGKLIAEILKIKYYTRDITPMVDAYFNTYDPDADRLRKGNMKARMRMCTIYDLAAQERALVLGTGNRTELLLGYVTQYGDGACALEPLGCLYKTEVWKLAEMVGVPQQIVEKTPTADLWEGQTDEGELGLTYQHADEILYNILEKNISIDQLVNMGFEKHDVIHIIDIMNRNRFKQTVPPNPETYLT